MDNKKVIEQNILLAREDVLWHSNEANTVSLNYSNYLTTIGALVLSLSPLLTNHNSAEVASMVLWQRVLFIVSLSFVLVSLIFGAVNAVKEKKFLQKWMSINLKIFKKWNEAHEGIVTLQEAEAYCVGAQEGQKNISASWPMICQAIFVFAGLLGIVINIVSKL